jgi:adenosylcobinamide-GDP ribazoletransferase
VLSALRAAVTFLTPLPLGGAPPTAETLRAAAPFFPLVGLGLGAAIALGDGAARAWLPPAPAALVPVLIWVVGSGALHLDGLCDVFDALMGGGDRERALRILRDPRAGTAGVVAVVLVLAAKLASVAALPEESRLRALVLAPAVGRAWLLPALALPPARPDGLAQLFRGPRAARDAALALATTALLAAVLGGSAALLALAASAIPVGWLLHRAWHRFGGTTGDVCGAAAELAETAFLLAMCSAGFRA